jgi:hypothetical protein
MSALGREREIHVMAEALGVGGKADAAAAVVAFCHERTVAGLHRVLHLATSRSWINSSWKSYAWSSTKFGLTPI